MASSERTTNCPDPIHLGERLLAWYGQACRALPWRDTQDPYAIWVAEIMLQQTRSEAVIPYYERFLARFPTVGALASAPLADVLKAWEGLGYYARARNLHAAARHVVAALNGQVPRSADALVLLPGIGRYTASAIASIAFGLDSIALDGNLRRVLCRIFAIDDDPGRPNTQNRLIALAHGMLPSGRAGDLNQALMDLGAGVCLPTHPRCLMCPLVGLCQAQKEGIQEQLPIRSTRRHRPHRDVTAAIIWNRDSKFLITQRPLDAMLGGMWEFPGGKRRPGEELAACLQREITEELDIEIEVGKLLCTVDHGYTHFHMTLYAYECQWLAGVPKCIGCSEWHWVTVDDLDGMDA
jgi:A/G-specific adenine glycosylase